MRPYYADDYVTLYHGLGEHILPSLSVSGLVVTDPPYNIGLNNDWQNAIHDAEGKARNKAEGGIDNDDGSIDLSFLSAYPRRIVFGFPYLQDPAATGWLVWDKEPGFKGRSLTSPIEIAYSTTWRGFRAIRLLWSGYMRGTREAKWGHPTQKPVELVSRVLADHPDDALILDPFFGTGTTLIAAKNLGRRAIGIEKKERYCEIAAERLRQEVLFGDVA